LAAKSICPTFNSKIFKEEKQEVFCDGHKKFVCLFGFRYRLKEHRGAVSLSLYLDVIEAEEDDCKMSEPIDTHNTIGPPLEPGQ
jgi:hypothetical protein